MNTTQELRPKISTELALFSYYQNSVVHLKDICREYLGISPKVAEEKAANNELPFETFRLDKRPPTLVKIASLAKCIDEAAEKAKRERENVRATFDQPLK